MACCDNCDEGRPCGPKISGWAARRRTRASDVARFGGAAARDSVPVSEGGGYHPERRGAADVASSSTSSVGGWHERRRQQRLSVQIVPRMTREERRAARRRDVERWHGNRHTTNPGHAHVSGTEDAPSVGGWHERRRRERERAAGHHVERDEHELSPRQRRREQIRRELVRGRRVGGILGTDAEYQAQIDSLDRDWNGLSVAVCDTARGLGCDTETARRLGPAWVAQFRSTLGQWRDFRDDYRQRLIHWGFGQDSDEIDGWRRELARLRDDVTAAGVTTVSPREADPDMGDVLATAARGTGEALSTNVIRPLGFVLAALLGLWGLSTLRR